VRSHTAITAVVKQPEVEHRVRIYDFKLARIERPFVGIDGLESSIG